MTTLNATFYIPKTIQDGLCDGRYERVGGVIIQSATGQIVAWLRENHVRKAMNFAPSLSAVLPFIGALNLAVSVGGFALLLNRIQGLEKGVRDVSQKIDFGGYANLSSAIQQANSAVMMSNPSNRVASAMQAIDRLLVAEHYFTNLLDVMIKEQNVKGAHELLSTIRLAHTAEAICYLEIDERQIAFERFSRAYTDLLSRHNRLSMLMTGLFDAPFFHPYVLQTEPRNVVERLYEIHKTVAADESVQKMIEIQTSKLLEKVEMYKYNYNSSWNKLNDNVRHYLDILEAMQEENGRFAGYTHDFAYIASGKISWQAWREVKPKIFNPDADYFVILP